MKTVTIFGGSVIVVVLLVVVVMVLYSESPHDKDLRECKERYAASPYAPADIRAYQADMVRACMRGRGY
jgi:hypothetical protein